MARTRRSALPDRRPRRRIALQERDLFILETLVIRRAETLDELHRLAFADRSRKRAINRLGELAAGGYLQRTSVEVLGADEPQSVYTLGPRAKRALELRSLASEHFRYRRFNPILRDSSIPHQIATNRVADWLGADLIPEHLLPAKDANAARHRPDGIYQTATPDTRGRTAVFLEVDLGHYSRARIIGKARAFLDDPEARMMVFVSPTDQRADWLASTLRAEWGEHIMARIAPVTFDQLRAGSSPTTTSATRTLRPAPTTHGRGCDRPAPHTARCGPALSGQHEDGPPRHPCGRAPRQPPRPSWRLPGPRRRRRRMARRHGQPHAAASLCAGSVTAQAGDPPRG